MPMFDGLLGLPFLKSVYRSLALALVAFFVLDCWIAAQLFDRTSTSETAAEYANGLALGAAALVAFVIARHHPILSAQRLFWWCAAIALAVLGANEAFDVFERMGRAWAEDDYSDLAFLFLTPIGIYAACTLDNVPRISLRAMQLGFAFQCISDVIDLGDGDLYTIALFNRNLMEVLTELSEMIFIETYLFGLACLLLHLVVRSLENVTPAPTLKAPSASTDVVRDH